MDIIAGRWDLLKAALIEVRTEVFMDEQKVPEALEWDEHDATCVHFLASDRRGTAIGCARLLPDGHIGRMAVRKEYRHQGIGSDLLQAVLKHARGLGFKRAALSAQTHAIEFYRRAGFELISAPFMDAGIPHVRMQLDLDATASDLATEKKAVAHQPPPYLEHSSPRLGTSTEVMPLEGDPEFLRATNEMLTQARRTVKIFTQSFDPPVYDTDSVAGTIAQLAHGMRPQAIRILIKDTGFAQRNGHKIAELATKLASVIEIREFPDDIYKDMDEYCIVDDIGLIKRYQRDRSKGYCQFRSVPDAVKAARYFDSAWERAHPCNALRKVHF